MMKKILVLMSLVGVMVSCDVAQQLAGTYSLTQCKYDYHSISGLTVGGVNLQDISSLSSLNPLAAANLLTAFSSPKGNLPMQFTLNLDVTNPGYQTALLNGLQYILEIDGIEMTTGGVDSKLQIATGQKAQLPITLGFDLKKVMSGQSADAIKNLAFNFAGIGSNPSKVTFKLKPTLLIGNQTLNSPSYIPVSFTLNGK